VPLLRDAGIEDGARDARVLLAHASIGHDRLIEAAGRDDLAAGGAVMRRWLRGSRGSRWRRSPGGGCSGGCRSG
jgi:hypothetical protein